MLMPEPGSKILLWDGEVIMLIPVSERFSINTEQFFVHERRSALRLTVNRFARLLSIIISPLLLNFKDYRKKY
jgi:hypothetical protein